ncbi:MAG: choice-of-anchor L domain-containing protein [Deltaproteobacteria bacterium]|nr:choice-of-anchor L domain-containing protein [Deltaproteobacteria bacterium]
MRIYVVSVLVASAALAGCNTILGISDLTTAGIDAGGDAASQACTPTTTRACYTGAAITANVGACHDGIQTCQPSSTWGPCVGEVVPGPEICANGADENCSGAADEDVDLDHDGFTTCGGDCCDSVECAEPALVNPGAYDLEANHLDDDCDGAMDDPPLCDDGLATNASDPRDFARAMDLCPDATTDARRWGVISATWTLTDGTGVADPRSHAVRDRFGTAVVPHAGAALAVLSSGVAADADDLDPAFANNVSTQRMQTAPVPADWLAAHNGALPVAPGCPAPNALTANDPVMLTLQIRVPVNARSFAFDSDFFTWEFPEWVCSPYNDFLVALLDSTWNDVPANPRDKNLAAYRDAQQKIWPVGVNLATLDAGLFTQCVNGAVGCAVLGGMTATITTCTGTDQLPGTGFETGTPGMCTTASVPGGATGWLTTRGNVVGGETITLRLAIWDTSDGAYDSTAVIDHFRWSGTPTSPGTVHD